MTKNNPTQTAPNSRQIELLKAFAKSANVFHTGFCDGTAWETHLERELIEEGIRPGSIGGILAKAEEADFIIISGYGQERYIRLTNSGVEETVFIFLQEMHDDAEAHFQIFDFINLQGVRWVETIIAKMQKAGRISKDEAEKHLSHAKIIAQAQADHNLKQNPMG